MTETNTAVGGFLAIGLALCWFALLAWREHRRATRGMDLRRGAAHIETGTAGRLPGWDRAQAGPELEGLRSFQSK